MKKDLVKLRFLVKKKKKSVLNRIIDFFSRSSYTAYLVGGFVRDTIMGETTKDIDISVQGDAIKAGYSLNSVLKGKAEIHKQFGTISICKDNMRIDLATTRKETYPYPGALPKITQSNIYEDLKRRDFSVNAIALCISKNNLGKIFDPFDGIGDIRRRLIRVLHNNSFIDDPTRILRALRYKNRLKFKLEASTESLLREAVSKRMLEKISKQRLMNELKLIFAEKDYLDILNDLKHYRIFTFNKRYLKNINAMEDLKYYYFLCLIGTKNFPLSNQEKKIVKDLNKLTTLGRLVRNARNNATLYFTLSVIDDKVVKIIPKVYPELKQKIRQYNSLKKNKPFIDGKDLQKLNIKPGPRFKEILTRMYKLQLNGKIKSKKMALTFLKNG